MLILIQFNDFFSILIEPFVTMHIHHIKNGSRNKIQSKILDKFVDVISFEILMHVSQTYGVIDFSLANFASGFLLLTNRMISTIRFERRDFYCYDYTIVRV